MAGIIKVIDIYEQEVNFIKTAHGYSFENYQIPLQLNEVPNKTWLEIFNNLSSKSTNMRKFVTSIPVFKEDLMIIKRASIEVISENNGYLDILMQLISQTNEQYQQYINQKEKIVNEIRGKLLEKKIIEM